MKLKRVLERYSSAEVSPLGATKRRSLSNDEREALKRDLDRIERSNARLVWIAVSLLVGLFVAWLVVVLGPERGSGTIRVASTAFGLSAAGCIRWLLSTWREKSSAALLIQLAVALEGEALAAVITVLTARARA